MSGEGDLIESHGGQIMEQGGETVDRISVRGCPGGSLGLGLGGGLGLLHRRFTHHRSLILEQQRSQTPAQVPFQVPGQQAQQDMPTHVLFAVDKHRPHLEPSCLHRSKGPLDLREALVGCHRLVGIDGLGIQIGADDVDAVEAGLGLDLPVVAGPLQPLMGNGEVEVFFDPVAMGLAGEGLESAVSVLGPGLVLAGGCGDPCQLGFGGPQQILPLAGPLLA